jgi:Flp pilus assembly protein TadB
MFLAAAAAAAAALLPVYVVSRCRAMNSKSSLMELPHSSLRALYTE